LEYDGELRGEQLSQLDTLRARHALGVVVGFEVTQGARKRASRR
jgi:hypothetical protein